MHFQTSKTIHKSGFSLTEALITSSIVGTLTAIALPNFMGALDATKQREAQATVAQVQTIIMAYIDETNKMPKSWNSINSIAAIMQAKGDGTVSQSESNDFETIILPGQNYSLSVDAPSPGKTVYEISANPITSNSNYDIRACLDVSNGANDLRTGSSSSPAESPQCS
jgi:type IV pilus assembly protein PilA